MLWQCSLSGFHSFHSLNSKPFRPTGLPPRMGFPLLFLFNSPSIRSITGGLALHSTALGVLPTGPPLHLGHPMLAVPVALLPSFASYHIKIRPILLHRTCFQAKQPPLPILPPPPSQPSSFRPSYLNFISSFLFQEINVLNHDSCLPLWIFNTRHGILFIILTSPHNCFSPSPLRILKANSN